MTDKTFSQGDLDRIISERLERQKNQFEAKLTALDEEKNKAKLLEDEEYKTLIDKLTGENTAFKEQVGKLTGDTTEYHKIMEGVLSNALEGLPEEVVKAVESLPGDVKQKLDWMTTNGTLFTKELGDGVGSPASNKPSKDKPKSKFRPKGI